MSFLSHREAAGTPGPGTIDYRMARQWVIDQYHRGRLAQHEVCDAHPELRRAAKSVAEPTKQICPICKDENVVLVTYVFGPRLPAFGRCITSKAELRDFAAKAAKGNQYTCYIVEVCPGCWWNHLAQTFLIGRVN
ncbi:MAG: DUF5318 family protein [Acidimicrobiia bacterium]